MHDPHFFQKCCHFQYNISWLCFDFSKNDNTFERNEDCATVFLKWMDFSEISGSMKIQTHIPIDFWPQCVSHLIKNLTFDAVLVKLSCWTHAGFQMKSWSIQHQFFYHLHLDKISFIICAKILKDSKKYTMNDWVRDELGVPGI